MSLAPDEQLSIPGFPKPAPPGAPMSDVILMLDGIRRDPALQCRSALDEPTVVKYVEVVDQLPPVRVIRVGDVDYLVDGWHRFEAHVRAKRSTIHAVIDTGDRRDAILAAVKANSSHGLPRSHDDTRRAVKVLLMDDTWCKLSDRKLADLADVSHTHVANQRKQYGVKAGSVLTEEQANRLDGKWPPAWEAIREKAAYAEKDLEKIRATTTPDHLAKVRPESYATHLNKAFELRAGEMATAAWPWPEDESDEDIKARFERLDTPEDLLDAAGSNKLIPTERAAAYRLVEMAREVERKFWLDAVPRYQEAFVGRPALLARLEGRVVERKAEEAAKPKEAYAIRREIEDEKNPLIQARLVSDCSEEMFRTLDGKEMLPVVRNTEFRWRWSRRGNWDNELQPLETCPIPGCGGFVKPVKEDYYQNCTTCGKNAPRWRVETREALVKVALLLKHDGYGFIVDNVIIDAKAIANIKAIKMNASPTVAMKGDLGKACRALVSQPHPTILCVDSKPPPPPKEDEAGADIDEDSEAYQAGVDAYADELDADADVLQYATEKEQRNFLEGFKVAKDEAEGGEG